MGLAVLGSLNLDIQLKCRTLALPGETVLAESAAEGPGGKGLNQAVAARRAGAQVQLIGAIGADDAGRTLLDFLAEEEIGTGQVEQVAGATTGRAYVMVDALGENAIVVSPGANGQVKDSSASNLPEVTKIALCQLEIPLSTVEQFLMAGRAKGAMTLLNAAPFLADARALFELADILIVNETELAGYAGAQIGTELEEGTIIGLARGLISRVQQEVVVTLGARGLIRVTGSGAFSHAAHSARVVDTTGAGDCFCGVLAAGLVRGLARSEATDLAIRAASLAVSRTGAAAVMPLLAEFASC